MHRLGWNRGWKTDPKSPVDQKRPQRGPAGASLAINMPPQCRSREGGWREGGIAVIQRKNKETEEIPTAA